MDNTIKLNCKKPIYILTIISLLFSIVGCLRYFFYFAPYCIYGTPSGVVKVYVPENNLIIDAYELKFFVPNILSFESILTVLTLSSIILLVLYIFVFYKKLKGRFVLPIIFGILSIKIILETLTKSRDNIIICALLLIGYILGMISSINRFQNKKLIIITISILLALETLLYIYRIIHLTSYDPLYYNYLYLLHIFYTSCFIGKISLYITILLFALKNKIPSIQNVINKNKKIAKTNPEQELKLLKDKFKFGMITEEEYNTQRAEIISKL